jgi:hypothetical protein
MQLQPLSTNQILHGLTILKRGAAFTYGIYGLQKLHHHLIQRPKLGQINGF